MLDKDLLWLIRMKNNCFATSSKAFATFSPFLEEVSKNREHP